MLKVLIVEDTRLLSEALRTALQAHFPFLAPTKVASVQEALAEIDAARPDLIFTDVHLPDGNGLDFIRSIRAAGIESAIVVLTNHDLPEYRQAALRSGANHFVSKGSIKLGDIYGVVESILAARFRVLVVAEDAAFRDKMELMLARGWPNAVLACAGDWEAALETTDTLKPDLVVVRSQTNTEWDRRFGEAIGVLRAGASAVIVSVCDADFAGAPPVDHRLEDGAEFSEAMATVIDLALAGRAGRLQH